MTTSFLTTLPSLLRSTGDAFNLVTSTSSTPAFKLAKFDFSLKLELSIPVVSLISAFVA